jgi:hypothetical protein
MPLVIPTAATTYADSTNTGGAGLLRNYVWHSIAPTLIMSGFVSCDASW